VKTKRHRATVTTDRQLMTSSSRLVVVVGVNRKSWAHCQLPWSRSLVSPNHRKRPKLSLAGQNISPPSWRSIPLAPSLPLTDEFYVYCLKGHSGADQAMIFTHLLQNIVQTDLLTCPIV